MLAILSPAKIQDFSPKNIVDDSTQTEFIKESEELIELLRVYSVPELSSILKTSLKIAEECAVHYHRWHRPFTAENAKQAGLVYDGEAFRGLDFPTLDLESMQYLQNHLRIFSSLYGALRPLDLIQAYRLDQNTKLKSFSGENLNQFWRKRLTNHINKALKTSDNPQVLANLASAEYAKLLDKKKLNAEILDFEFLQYQPDSNSYKQATIYTKKARGMMVRFIAENRISDPEMLKVFSADGYWYSESHSKENKLVFIR